MEKSDPLMFQDKEKLEEDQFYRDWLRDILKDRVVAHGDLIALLKSIDSLESSPGYGYENHSGVSAVMAARESIQTSVTEMTEDLIGDITKNVFETNRFDVYILSNGEYSQIEGITAVGKFEEIVPIVDGRPFPGRVEDVVFGE